MRFGLGGLVLAAIALGCARAPAAAQDAPAKPVAAPAEGWGATYTVQVLGAG